MYSKSAIYTRAPEIADKRYKGKIIRVAAAVRRLGTDNNGNSVAYLVSGYDTYSDAISVFSRDYSVLDWTVLLICRGGGHDGSHAILVDCQTYNDAIGFDPSTELLPQGIDEQINRWFGEGIPPAFLKGGRHTLTVFFMFYWAGTNTNIAFPCLNSGRDSGRDACVQAFTDLYEKDSEKKTNFLHDYQSASGFLHLPKLSATSMK